MTRLSVNINKFATLRNARGENQPNIVKVSEDIQRFGADGITIHPRPDQRHIRYDDINPLKQVVHTELNIEGNPTKQFIELVCQAQPAQVTLVPDKPDALTSSEGWQITKHSSFLKEVIQEFRKQKIRTSIFVDPNVEMVEAAANVEADRIELYTSDFAHGFAQNDTKVLELYYRAAHCGKDLGLKINAGHNLNLQNLATFLKKIPFVAEVSIGHALICEAIYYGLENTIRMYQNIIKNV